MIQKNFFTTVAMVSTVLLLFISGCGTQQASGTPLGHHPKNQEQYDFNPNLFKWEVDNGEGLRIHVDNQYIYLQFDHTEAGDKITNIQFIIDIDNNHTTGNAQENGADYIVENGYLYQSKSRDLWDWKEIGKVKSTVESLIDIVQLEKQALHYSGGIFTVNAEALDDKWQPVLYSPSAQDENGAHLKTIYIPVN